MIIIIKKKKKKKNARPFCQLMFVMFVQLFGFVPGIYLAE